MQLLIGYLVALAVFLGGGYAGVQWLLTPEDPSALAQPSRSEPASARLIHAKKIRDARALHRKQAETLAEGDAKPSADTKAADAVAGAGEPPAKAADRSDTVASAADRPQDDAATEASASSVNDAKLNARAEVIPALMPENIKPAPTEPQAGQRPIDKSDGEGPAATRAGEAKPAPVPGPATPAQVKKHAAAKKKRVEKVASSSRKPVMMILRTIEFPDGHREQRLLPMAQARARLPEYRSLSAFADDDDF